VQSVGTSPNGRPVRGLALVGSDYLASTGGLCVTKNAVSLSQFSRGFSFVLASSAAGSVLELVDAVHGWCFCCFILWKVLAIVFVRLRFALRLTFNPISKVRTSSKRLREKDVLTPTEFQALVAQLSVRDRAMVLLAGSTGLRRSEFIALTWADVNTDTLEVNVLRSCVRNHFGNTKTECSRRPVPLHPLVLEALLKWREQSLYREPTDFLFHRSGSTVPSLSALTAC
jgi:integrase